MATVTAADEALSSCSQNATYSATIIAAQIRSAKPQAESGNPAMVTVRPTLCTRVMATFGSAVFMFASDIAAVLREQMQRFLDRTVGVGEQHSVRRAPRAVRRSASSRAGTG